ncbi:MULTISPECIES: McrB family protein [Psychrobacter]|uniref:Restriction endonuclease n=1 Tax=Psychrobacter alimentarius TaxID=261164 RepID=A0ABM5ZWP9_9GAMM|nr:MULTISPECIES: hypothetical protein [Psychrobacter]AMT96520.1 Restriction endonuclease [Psychrobacter alimentarius]QCB31092.1 hypothetical protein E5677_08850 [Psychrobacter sp. PAMC27889]
MPYISLETLVSARKDIKDTVSKPEEFFGIVLFLICTCETKINGSYLKVDIQKFSEYADNAFYFSDSEQDHQRGFKYGLLVQNWRKNLRNRYLKRGQVSLKSFMYSLYWNATEKEILTLLKKIPEDFRNEFFIDDISTTDFNCSKSIQRQDLLKITGNTFSGSADTYTKKGVLRFDNVVINNTRAGTFNGGSPFTFALFPKTVPKDLDKILLTYDFDIFEGYSFLPNSIGTTDQSLENTTSKLEPSKNKVKPIKINRNYDNKAISKPFLLLAGISGTGKTRFVRDQAILTGSLSDTYCLIPVRPDWHEPSDILGYISRLGGNGNAEYITTDVLQFIAKAWRAIIDAGLELESEGNGLAVTGDKSELDQVLPYWLCLDEMNLAPVEQYFADYLSVLETREWQWDDEQFIYCCDPLLKSATIEQLEDKSKLRDALGFADQQYDDAWDLFCEHGLGLPFNLIVAGTVNMDETTHGFSRKVIDRALSFDFGDFFPNEFDHFFEPTVTHNALNYPIDSQASIDKLPPIDSDGNKSINFLKSINKVLDDTPFQLAFRALNELLLAVISAYPEDEKQLQAVWDDFLMCKVLPRIEGDHDKLAVIDDSVSSHEESLLTELTAILKQELVDIWSMEDDQDKLRPDLYRKNIDGSVLNITCRSKAKLAWMQQRLERSGFTSFWP